MSGEKQARRHRLRAKCQQLSGHGRETPADLLARTATWCREHDIAFDTYGTGQVIEDLESRVAERLGFAAARFMPSGTMAQQVALRVWCERAGLPHVGMHPTSHLELHEHRGYAHLHGLTATLVGPASRPLLAEHFLGVKEALAALLVELPIREAGGQLPTWEQLDALKSAVRASDTRLHLDGARLWECKAGYGRSYRDICDGFDSCYVSFYKGIGALSGAMLLGDRAFIEEAAIWQRRCGGNLYTLVPNIASAAMLFDDRLDRMPAYFERAKTVAALIGATKGVQVLPDPPHTNMMHVFVPMDAASAMDARDRVADELGVWLFNTAQGADVPGHCRFELYVGEAACVLDDETIAGAIRALVAS